jgi:esterase/lipase superfamily enzyme
MAGASNRLLRAAVRGAGLLILLAGTACGRVQVAPAGPPPAIVQEGGTSGTVVVDVTGEARDREGGAIANAVVGVSDWDGAAWKPVAQTDEEGRYRFRVRLRRGGYRLVIALAGFEVAGSHLEILDRDLDVRLSPADHDFASARRDVLPSEVPSERLLPRDVGFAPPPPPPPPPPLVMVMPPVGGQAEVVDVFYGTNRRPQQSGGSTTYDARAPATALQYGVATVHIPPTHQPGELERPQIWRLEFKESLSSHFVITSVNPTTGAGFYDRLNTALRSSNSEAFLFVHGYNVTFDEAVLRTAQLFTDLHFSGAPIMFSWPAQNAWWRYLSAEDQATAAVPYLQEFIRGIALVGKPRTINVIAHSMGNRVMVNALSGLMQDPELRKSGLFRNLVLAAPDVSLDNFNAVAAALKQAAARVTVYASSADVPLKLSYQLHQFKRVGQAPPSQIPAGIDAIDASAVTDDMMGHSYFSYSQSLLADMMQLLKGDAAPPRGTLVPVTEGGVIRFWRVPKQRIGQAPDR